MGTPTQPLLIARVDDFVFDLVAEAAAKGERCPKNIEIWILLQNAGLPTGRSEYTVLEALGRQGKIRGKVSGRNWRTIEILVGPHAGKETRWDPCGGAGVHWILDRNGWHRPHVTGKVA